MAINCVSAPACVRKRAIGPCQTLHPYQWRASGRGAASCPYCSVCMRETVRCVTQNISSPSKGSIHRCVQATLRCNQKPQFPSWFLYFLHGERVANLDNPFTQLCAAGAIGSAAWDSGKCLPASYTHETTAPIYLGNTCHAAIRPLAGQLIAAECDHTPNQRFSLMHVGQDGAANFRTSRVYPVERTGCGIQ